MTFNQLKLLARAMMPGMKTDVLPDTSTSTQAGLDLVLNEGVKDISDFTACLPTNKKFNAVASQGTAANPYIISSVIGNFLTMGGGGFLWNEGTATVPQWKKLNPRTIEYLDENRSNWKEVADGTPEDYAIDGDNLYVIPAPVSSLTEGLWLFYSKSPTTMVNANVYPFSGTTTELTHLSKFDMAIIYYARAKISPMLNKETGENLSFVEYKNERQEKFNLLRRRGDLAQVATFQGPLIRP